MFGFLIKKWFFDLWDNFLAIILMNLGFVVVLTVPFVAAPALAGVNQVISIIVLGIGVVIFYVYASAVAFMTRDIAQYQQPGFKDFWKYLKEVWVSGLVLGLIVAFHITVVFFALPVYGGMGGLLGLAALAFLFWASVIWVLASQFYFPIRAQLDSKLRKVLKKCFIVFFDNTFFSILAGIATLAILILSVFTALLIPGFGGIFLFGQVALKLRLYKYDYLEEHPDANRRKIPWDALLVDDKERVGKRTLRGMIFPWKE